MSEYISRKAAINELNELFTICRETLPNENGKHYVVEEELCVFYNRISNIPAADVRPVILCRDCKYYFVDDERSIGGGVYEMCENSEGYDHVTVDGFCAWAKRKDGAEMKEEEA